MNTRGIIIEHNAKGIPAFARIDLKKYWEGLKFFFISKGVTIQKPSYNPEFVEKIKSQESIAGVKIKASEVWK